MPAVTAISPSRQYAALTSRPLCPPKHTPPVLLQPNGYIFTSLINACEKGGQWEQAVELFRLMQQRQQDIPLDSMAMVARKAL